MEYGAPKFDDQTLFGRLALAWRRLWQLFSHQEEQKLTGGPPTQNQTANYYRKYKNTENTKYDRRKNTEYIKNQHLKYRPKINRIFVTL